MKSIKASELTGAALDWSVAKCEDFKLAPIDDGDTSVYYDDEHDNLQVYTPSTDWKQGGPIIEREGISIVHQGDQWSAQTDDDLFAYGPTPLIAAMRCYVASKMGDTIEVPEELL